MNKTVLYIGGFELPDKNAAANRVVSNAYIFRKLGYEVLFFGVNKNIEYKKDFQLITKEFEGFVYYENGYPNSFFEWYHYMTSINMILKIINLISDISIVICYNYQAIAYNRVRKYCQRNKITIIADCTEWYGAQSGGVVFNMLKYLDNLIRLRYVNKKVDKLIVVSSYFKKFYKNKETIVLPPLVRNTHYQDEEEITYNKPKLIYAGLPFRLGKRIKSKTQMKDRLDLALRLLHCAHTRGVDFIFDIYGLSKEQYLEALPTDYEIIKDMGEKVHFLGRIPQTELKGKIRAAHFTILLRNNNKTSNFGFPSKVAESISLGTPVVTTKTSDLNRYILERQTGYFLNMGDIDATKNKLCMILSELSNIQRMKNICLESGYFDYKTYILRMDVFLRMEV